MKNNLIILLLFICSVGFSQPKTQLWEKLQMSYDQTYVCPQNVQDGWILGNFMTSPTYSSEGGEITYSEYIDNTYFYLVGDTIKSNGTPPPIGWQTIDIKAENDIYMDFYTANVYVEDSTTGKFFNYWIGDNANYPECPWYNPCKTCETHGDDTAYYIRRGTRYHDDLRPQGTLNSDNNIYAAYGSEASKPILKGTNSLLYNQGDNYIWFTDFTIRKGNTDEQPVGENAGDSTWYIRLDIDSCVNTDNGLIYSFYSTYPYYEGIYIDGTNNSDGGHGIKSSSNFAKFRGCHIENILTGGHGISIPNLDTIDIQLCLIDNVDNGWGFEFNINDVTGRYLTAKECSYAGINSQQASSENWDETGCFNHDIRDFVIHECGNYYGGLVVYSSDENGRYENLLYEDGYIYGSIRRPIYIRADDSLINVIFNRIEIDSVRDVPVYGWGIAMTYDISYCDSLVFSNILCYDVETDTAVFIAEPQASPQFLHCNFWNEDIILTFGSMRLENSIYNDKIGSPDEANNLTDCDGDCDTNFVDIANGDARLKSNASSIIDQGEDVGIKFDFGENPYKESPSLGCYEFWGPYEQFEYDNKTTPGILYDGKYIFYYFGN